MRSTGAGLLFLSLAFLPLATRQDDPERARNEGLVFTLYARDGLQSSFDFRRGRAGGHVVDGEIRLDDAQVVFDAFAPDQLSVGFLRDERVELLDLGELDVPPQARASDRAEKFALSVFHTLFLDGERLAYVGPGGDAHPLDGTSRLFATPPEGLRHVQPVVGHVYVIRALRRTVGSADDVFKFLVLDHVPQQSLTMRWVPVPRR